MHIKGIRKRFYFDGTVADSSNFDGEGNGSVIHWNYEGRLFSEAHYTQDTLKTGKWKYYQADGKAFGIVDYEKGKKIACDCFDEWKAAHFEMGE